MPTTEELLAQRAEIDRQIAANKLSDVQAVRALMTTLGVTMADLSSARAVAAPVTGRIPVKRPVKYRDEGGNTWTGVGQRPRWLMKAVAAGTPQESFRIPE